MRICVYCASSQQCDRTYHDDATRLGERLARDGCTIVYGGGAIGLMGSLANGAIAAGGRVIGVIPRFMTDVEWQHPGLASLEIVEDMRERKHRLLTGSDAVVAMPGGCGTLEELFEAITLKRLGLYLNPIVLLNTNGFFFTAERFHADCDRTAFHECRACGDVVDGRIARRRATENSRDTAMARRCARLRGGTLIFVRHFGMAHRAVAF
jgi:uncharacterized protein (TIGR00730 family)